MSTVEITENDYVTQVHASPATVDGAAWNSLLARQSHPTPFMRMEYLAALHASASATAPHGWAPQWLTLARGGELQAGCALYLKSHSYGEFVFDWAWADAYRRHGLAYYPKLLGAVPFTPAAGTRLLSADPVWRDRLVVAIDRLVAAQDLSSAHVLFISDQDEDAFERAGWMIRRGVQFHWTRDENQPVASFADLLATMQRDKRKKILQERRRVADQGVHITVHEATEIDEALWDFFYHCYTLTYLAHRSTPYLTRDFFVRMAQSMARNWVMFVARRGHGSGQPIAASLVAIDPDRGSAWGRYWGSVEPISCLHFEACYYQPLAWCIAKGYRRFEGGAQGEHKMARGLLPTGTASAHRLKDPRFASAVADFLAAEGQGVAQYVDELRERNPFKGG